MASTKARSSKSDSSAGALQWLLGRSARHRSKVVPYIQNVKRNQHVLEVPVAVPNARDVYRMAWTLQRIEDEWNNQRPSPKWRLWLVPAQ